MITLLISALLWVQNPVGATTIQKKEQPISQETKQKVDSLKADIKEIKAKIKARKEKKQQAKVTAAK
jgi:hypothetical protein